MKAPKILISLNEAMEILFTKLKSVDEGEVIPIEEAFGRVLYSDLIAPFDVPHFDRSAMDGYAVIAEDTFGASIHNPVILELIDSVIPGDIPKSSVERKKCIKVATGAMMPEGADSVVIFEDTEFLEGKVYVYKPVSPGVNITKRGADIRKDSLIMKRGTYLTPSRIGVLASFGFSEVEVFRKPEIAIIPTGNEVIPLGQSLQNGKIFNSNTFSLSALIKENGCIPVPFPICADEEEMLKNALKEALKYDMVVIIGGSSVGEIDIVINVLQKSGEILFNGIAVKPGKPTIGAFLDGKIILGMPGHPTSCLSNGYMILLPLIRKLANLPSKNQTILKSKISKRISTTIGRLQFFTVKIQGEEVVPVFKESGTITSMSEADGYIEIPGNKEVIERGEEVEVKLF